MRLTLALLLFAGLTSCGTSNSSFEKDAALDTIQTTSGLQYAYLKKGNGRQVEKGSLVNTKLSLMVNDSVVWTSYNAEDSLFSFIVGESSVIKGFEEMAYLMKEGDNVLAILPDSLAYGDRGAGNVIPPNATLVYDRYEMYYVSPPRINPVDTLIAVYLSDGITTFEQLLVQASNDTVTYHPWGEVFESDLLRKLERDSLYTEESDLAAYLGKRSNNYNSHGFAVNAYYYQKNYQEALKTMDFILANYKMSESDSLSWLQFRQQLVDSVAVN